MVKHHLHTIDIGDHKTKLYNSKTLTLQITFTKWPALSRICRVIFGRNISATTEIYENVWNCPHNCMQKPFCTMQRLASKNLMAVHNLLHWYIRKDSPFPWNVVKRQSMTSIASISKRFRTVYMNGGKVCCNKPVNTLMLKFSKKVWFVVPRCHCCSRLLQTGASEICQKRVQYNKIHSFWWCSLMNFSPLASFNAVASDQNCCWHFRAQEKIKKVKI